jgi:hypothetical protein
MALLGARLVNHERERLFEPFFVFLVGKLAQDSISLCNAQKSSIPVPDSVVESNLKNELQYQT